MMLKPLDDIKLVDLNLYGAKAVNLARIRESQIPVPYAVCLEVSEYENAFEDYLLYSNFNLLPKNHQKLHLQELRNFLNTYPLNNEIINELEKFISKHNKPFAVRSSGLDEDGSNYSFAGIFSTILGLKTTPQIIEAIKTVWGSLWSLEAFTYRETRNISQVNSKMGVIIQEQIKAKCSGVIFTRNPVTGDNEIVINASTGTSESTVSGINIPELLIIKPTQNGWNIKDVPKNFPLELGNLKKLVDYAIKLEEIFRGPQDIEWAYDSELYILQSRPLLISGDTKWSREHISDFVPEVLTPLSSDIIAIYLRERLFSFYGELGVQIPLLPYVIEQKGRVYVNSKIYEIIKNELYQKDDIEKKYQKAFQMLKSLPMKTGIYYQKIKGFSKIKNLNWEIFSRFFDMVCQNDPTFHINCLFEILNNYYRSHLTENLKVYSDYFINLGPLNLEIESFSFQEDLLGLLDDKDITNFLEIGNESNLPKSLSLFISKYGHWALSPLELSVLRYKEDFPFIVSLIKNLNSDNNKIKLKLSISKYKENITKKRAEIDNIKKEYEKNVNNKELAVHFSEVIDWLIYLINLRELQRKYNYIIFEILRDILLKTADLLYDSGFVPEKNYLFFLKIKDIETIFNHSYFRNNWYDYVKICKTQFYKDKELQYPINFHGQVPKPILLSPAIKELSQTVQGISLNKGKITAKARVLLNHGDLSLFEPGEILVVSACEPFWSIVFPLASGFISETGGLLSHAAILTREYNLPALSQIEFATKIIKTGDIINIDGDSGVVNFY